MYTFIGVASGLGGRQDSAGKGPPLIQETLPFSAPWQAMLLPQDRGRDKREKILDLNTRLARETYKAAKQGLFPIIVGGDHSCAIGTWSGIQTAYQEDLALLWFDAHMDCHTPKTSPSGNIHGMPLAALLGHGDRAFTHLLSDQPKFKGENVFLIGIRSFEEAELNFAKEQGIHIYFMEEVKKRGLEAIMQEILGLLQKKKVKYGISLDIDFFDPLEMSATGSPENDGPFLKEFFPLSSLLESYPPIAFEFVEYNPPFDQEGNSLRGTHQILECLVHTLQTVNNTFLPSVKTR